MNCRIQCVMACSYNLYRVISCAHTPSPPNLYLLGGLKVGFIFSVSFFPTQYVQIIPMKKLLISVAQERG